MVSGLDWSSDAAHLIVALILRIHAASLTSKTRGAWRIANLHSWREGILNHKLPFVDWNVLVPAADS